jgi:hypothetical protein
VPLVFGEIAEGDTIHCFESTWDALAFMDRSGERSGIVCTRGAGNAKFVIEAAARSKPSMIYLWTQNDPPGAASERDIVAGVQCTVSAHEFPLRIRISMTGSARERARMIYSVR